MAKPRRRKPVEEEIPSCGVFILESHHDKEFAMENLNHDFLKIIYIMSGAGQYITPRRRVICEARDILVVPIGQDHMIEDNPGQPISLYALCVESKVWSMEPAIGQALPSGRLAQNESLSRRVRAYLRLLLYEQTHQRTTSEMLITGLTLQLLTMLARSTGHARRMKGSEKQIASARQRVELFIRECDSRFFQAVDIDTAAGELGMSRRSFTQLFRDITNMSYVSYVHKQRIKYAKQLLKITERTIASIAFECGYEDLSGFYRAFARDARVSPNRWRKGHT